MKKSEFTQQPQQPQIQLEKTTVIETEGGSKIWSQGFVLRRVSRFITGGEEDGVMPIPVFYDQETGKILGEGLPPEIRGDYDTI